GHPARQRGALRQTPGSRDAGAHTTWPRAHQGGVPRAAEAIRGQAPARRSHRNSPLGCRGRKDLSVRGATITLEVREMEKTHELTRRQMLAAIAVSTVGG